MTRQGIPIELFDDLRDEANAEVEGAVTPVVPDDAVARLGRRLPRGVYLGTSSWSFPGWDRIVYDGRYSEAQLARSGLPAYAAHPVLRAVGIDRGFYQPLTPATYARYAQQVPDDFRFLVKAPALLTAATTRAAPGGPAVPNAHFLDPAVALESFIGPALEGLGGRCGPLVFQFSPLPRELFRTVEAAHALIARIGSFLAALPRTLAGVQVVYAIELRDPELLTP